MLPDALRTGFNRCCPLLRLVPKAVVRAWTTVLTTGIPWEYLPQELGCGSSMTCWRRLRDWSAAGVWLYVLAHLHQELGLKDRINWHRALVDSSVIPAKKGVLRRATARLGL